MNFYLKLALLPLVLLTFFTVHASAQTITIGAVDAGPYTPGSNIAVPVSIDYTAGCVKTNNVYTLYLSDAFGSFGARQAIGTFTGFYATFVNGIIPAGLTPGAGYKIEVESSQPVVTSTPVNINIIAGAPVTAAITAPPINAANPEIFGNCNGSNFNFIFDNASTTGSTTTVNIHDEATAGTAGDVNINAAPNGSFPATTTNYTVFVKAVNGGTVGTHAYMLINNVVNSNFGTTGTSSVCLGSVLTFTVDISSPNGIQHNFPGNTYNVNWGDGSAIHPYTLCEIIAGGGKITHTYTKSSCGTIINGQSNVFEVDLQPQSPYCPGIASPVTSYAKISSPPTNSFGANLTVPNTTCTNNTVTFFNNSYPGEDPNNTTGTCGFAGAKYAWYVDGGLVESNKALSYNFNYAFATTGTHTITLHLQNNPSTCPVADVTKTICVQDSPNPSFTVPAASCISGGPVTISPVNTFTIDNTCYNNPFKWNVTGGTYTFAGGTGLTSITPQFVFTTAGTYLINLSVTDACGTVKTATQQKIFIDDSPTVALSPDATYCGTQTLNFNNTSGLTKTTFTGTADPTEPGASFLWTVTPSAGASAAIFVNGTTAASQYPRITFPGYGTYTVTVKQTNGCGTSNTATQVINIQNAPTISAGAADNTVCASSNAFTLAGMISDPGHVVTSYKWTSSGDGTFDNSTTSLTPVYTLGPNDRVGGTIHLTLDVKTSLIGQCNNIPSTIDLTVTPADAVTSAPTINVCSGTALNYALSASLPNTTYTWTASGSANASGFTSQNTPVADPASITDVLSTSDPANSATVIYNIIPSVNGCPGTPFTLTVTIVPGPILAPIANAGICSGQSTGIALNANTVGTKYIWTATPSAGITGATNQATPTAITNIADVLNNSLSTAATVTYQITPVSTGGCAGAPVSTTITVQPLPTLPNAGPDDVTCNSPSYHLNANAPTVGNGKWTLASGQTGVNFANNTDPQTTVSGLQGGQVYQFSWTISTACVTNSDNVQITNNLPSVGGVAATAVNPVCYGSNGTITLSGQTGTVTGWEQSTNNGATWQSIATTATTLNYAGLTQTTSFRAVVQNGNCNISTSQPVTVTVSPPTVIANAGPDQILCNQTNTTLHGNDPGTLTGKWTQTGGPTAGVSITNPASYTTTITGLTGGTNYIFTWTIHGLPPCGDLSDDVAITDQSPITNTINVNGGDLAYICGGTSANLTGSVPTGGIAPYSYVWESSDDNGATWNVISGETGPNATVTVNTPILVRRTVYSDQLLCSQLSNFLNIELQTGIDRNSIATTSTEICNNTIPAIISGSLPTGGDGVYNYQWQSSTDGVAFTDIAGATGKDYQPIALSTTTYYQRMVNSNRCGGTVANTSNIITITVNPDVKANFTATVQSDCAPFNITAQIITATNDANAKTYTWYANGQAIGQGLAFPGYIIQNDGQAVNIKLVVSSVFGCTDATYALDFTTPPKVLTNFTADKTTGCGPLTVTFTNTSTPLTGTVFTWIFGDNTTYTGVTPPPHTFQPLANGRDVTYTVSLSSNGCTPSPATQQITVYPAKPVAAIDPGTLSSCAPYTINVSNLSPGTNANYTYYLYDDNNVLVQAPIVKTDKSSVQFNPITTTTTKIYTLYMVAKNLCGVTAESNHYPITIYSSGISALMTVTPLSNGIAAGCGPYQATFHNLSTGGSSYVYNIYDSNFRSIDNVVTNSAADQSYTFNTPGVYYVSIGVFSNCTSGKESAKTKVTVYASPVPDFQADALTSCTQLTVQFTNNTPGDVNAPATSYTYDWDFGDGTHSSQFAPTHTYDYKTSPYTVTLIATNNNGCSNTAVKTDYITVHPPPGTDFTALPDTITAIPNYHFDFVDKSAAPGISWEWDFGDGSVSTKQNPSHTYADTGAYQVKLTVHTQYGCTDSKAHTVRITGVPGQLYVPNAFMPTSLTNELRTFTIKGSGIKAWDMRIFNNWGQLVFETTKLNSHGEPVDFWDGRFKGQDAQQGIYAWEISATFINGTQWKGMSYKGEAPKRAGTLNLIR